MLATKKSPDSIHIWHLYYPIYYLCTIHILIPGFDELLSPALAFISFFKNFFQQLKREQCGQKGREENNLRDTQTLK